MLCTLSPMLPGLGTALDKRRGNCRLIPVQGLDPLITNISPGEQNWSTIGEFKISPLGKKINAGDRVGSCMPASPVAPQLCFWGLGALGLGTPSCLPSQALWAGAQLLTTEAAHYFAAVDLKSEINWVSNMQASVWYRVFKGAITFRNDIAFPNYEILSLPLSLGWLGCRVFSFFLLFFFFLGFSTHYDYFKIALEEYVSSVNYVCAYYRSLEAIWEEG